MLKAGPSTVGAAVLCGGESRRMGVDKAALTIGGETFLQRILSRLPDYGEVLISVRRAEDAPDMQLPVVADRFSGCGPMAGLHAVLSACHSDAMQILSCDLPFYRAELGALLFTQMTEGIDAVIPVTADGHTHPLCALYRRTAAPVFERHLTQGCFAVCRALDALHTIYLPVPAPLAHCLQNINTPEDYAALLRAAQKSNP